MRPFACLLPVLVLLSSLSIKAQSYQSSFSPVTFNRLNGPSVQKGIAEVDIATGAVDVNMPLGPGIGTRGATFRPAIRGRHAPIRVETPIPSLHTYEVKNISKSGLSLAPGRLRFFGDYLLGRYEGPNGESERFGLGRNRMKIDARTILDAFGYTDATVTSEPYLEGARSYNGWQWSEITSLPSPVAQFGLSYTDSGALILPISTGANPSLSVTSHGSEDPNSDMWIRYQIPQRILVVKGDVAYEYMHVNHSWVGVHLDGALSESGNYIEEHRITIDIPEFTSHCVEVVIDQMPQIQCGELYETNEISLALPYPKGVVDASRTNAGLAPPKPLRAVDYVLSRIVNRFGESIRFDYGTQSSGLDYTAEWYRGETPTGIRIKQQRITQGTASVDAKCQIRLSYEGVSHTSYLLEADYVHLKTPEWWAARGTYVEDKPPQNLAGKGALDDPMQDLRITRVVPESAPSEAVTWTWSPIGSAPSTTDQGRLDSIASPGRIVSFQWDMYPYRENLSGDFAMGFHSSGVSRINGTPVPFTVGHTYAYGVKQTDDKDVGSGAIRTSRFIRKVPEPNWDYKNTWISRDAYTAVIHPDESQFFYRFAEAPLYKPVEEGDILGGPHSSNDQRMWTLAFMKSVLLEERHYAAGVDWQTDVGRSPEQSQAYRVVLRDRLTLRSVVNPNGVFFQTSLPMVTRTRELDRLNQTWSQSELVDWDPVGCGWRKRRELLFDTSTPLQIDILSLADRVLSPSDGPAVLTKFVDMVHESDLSRWLLGRNTEMTSTTQSDTTGRLASGTSLPQTNAKDVKTYDSLNRIMAIQQGSSTPISAGFEYLAAAGPEAASLKKATLTGAYTQSGAIGATYDSDGLGFLTGIHPALSSPDLAVQQQNDGLGRAQRQTGMDGMATGIQWDALNRLGELQPPGGELSTAYTVDSDGLGVMIQRGQEKSQVRYNGFGELVIERRWDASGNPSHRVFGYDAGGRKAWETVWRSGLGDEHHWHSSAGPDDDVTPAWTEEVCDQTATCYNPPNPPEICCVQSHFIQHPARVNFSKSTHYAYDPVGRLQLVVDPNQSAARTEYGVRTRTVTKGLQFENGATATSPATARTIFEYDAAGRLSRVVDAKNQVTDNFYDGAGRIAEVDQYPSSSANASSWVGTGTPQQRIWKYNSLGWLVLLDQPESGATYYSSFTIQGKPQETVYGLPKGWRPGSYETRDATAAQAAGVRVVNTLYDDLGRSVRVWSNDGSVDSTFAFGRPGTGDPVASFGKLVHTGSIGGISRNLSYDALTGRLALQTCYLDGNPFPLALKFDPNYGRLVQVDYPSSKIQKIDYDHALGSARGVGFNSASASSLAGFNYGPVDWNLNQISFFNATSTQFTYGDDQTRLRTLTHGIPGANFQKIWTFDYDAAGNLTKDGEDFYTYDALGRLIQSFVRDPFDGLDGKGNQGIWQTFTFDAFGNRTGLDSRTVTNWTQGVAPPAPLSASWISTSKAKTYTFAPADAAFQKNQLPRYTATNVPTGADYDAQGNLKSIFRTPGQSGEALYHTYDALGRVKTMTDVSRNVTEVYTYDDRGLRAKVEVYQGSVATQNLQKKQYRIYNEARQMVAEYELVLE